MKTYPPMIEPLYPPEMAAAAYLVVAVIGAVILAGAVLFVRLMRA